MEGQISSGKYTLPNFAQDLHVMLVDFETTSLYKIKAKLEKFSYQVTGVNRASEALSMIGENKKCYKFVIANYRTLPKMDYGSFVHELWQKEIPLIWMSRSYDEAEQALHDGASFLLIEPISSKKLKPLWQFAFRRRSNQQAGGAFGSAARLDLPGIQNKQEVKKEQVNQRDKEKELITKTNNQQEGSKHKRLIDDQQGNMQDKRTKYTLNIDKSESILELQELNQNERGREGHGNRNEKGRERPVWTEARRNNFEAAYSKLGVRATAKTTYEEMNDPNITVTQVASYLQKFKNSLQKKNVDSGATSLPVTNNSSSSLARHPGNKNLPNFTPMVELDPAAGLPNISPYANQNQERNTIRAASISTRHQSQLQEGGVAGTTEPVGSLQGVTTTGIVIEVENFQMNSSGGIQNDERRVEQAFAAGSSNQNQPQSELSHMFIPEDETVDLDGIFDSINPDDIEQNQEPMSLMTYLQIETGKEDLEGVLNSQNPGDIEQNQEPMVEQAPAAGSSNHGFSFLDNEEVNRFYGPQEQLDFELRYDAFGESTDM